MQTPIGLMTDFYGGWCFPSYDNILYRVWGNLPMARGTISPTTSLAWCTRDTRTHPSFHDERGFAAPRHPTEIRIDFLLSDAPGWLLGSLSIIGRWRENFPAEAEIRDKLQAYVAQGGKLFITAGSLRNLPGGLGGH